MNFIYGRLDGYRQTLQGNAQILEPKLNLLFDSAADAVTIEPISRTVNVATKVATSIFTLDLGGLINNLIDGQDQVAQSLVPTEQLRVLKRKILPLIPGLFDKMLKAIKKKSIQKVFYAARTRSLNNSNLGVYYMAFLDEYRSYDSPITAGMIAEFGTVLDQTIDELCEMLFQGSTAASAMAQYEFANIAGCLGTKKDVAVMVAVYQEYYQFQYDMLDAVASYVRATIAMKSSRSLLDIQTKLDATERNFTKMRAHSPQERTLNDKLRVYSLQKRYFTKMRVHSLEIYIQSEMQLRMVIHEACSLIEYKSGGVIPGYCHRLKQDPYSTEYDNLVAYRYERDMCSDDQITKYARIPAAYPTSNQPAPRGTIDLASLYSGNLTSFQIPNKNWLIENHWLSEHDANSAWFIKRFELFLPYASSDRLQVHVTKVMIGHNVITPRGILYDFTTPVRFDLRYLENAHSCYNSIVDLDHPYQTPGCEKPSQICIISRGENENAAFHASVYSRWSLALKVDDGNLTPVDPVGDFYLQAGIILCKVSNVPNRATAPVRHARASGRQNVCCADSSQYFDQARGTCANCPDHGCVKLGGYFCGNCTTNWQ